MNHSFACGHCRTINRFTTYSINYWRENNRAAMQRCMRCGAAHGCRDYQAEVIPPLMLPLNQGSRLSPWMPPEYRPVNVGYYECDFRGLAIPVFIFWDDFKFCVSHDDPRRVNMRTLYRWRGSWA
jgi:hypothetical protein